MGFKIISSTEGAALIEKDGKDFLAIATGLKNKAFAGVKTARLQSIPGLLVGNGQIENWKTEGLAEIEGETYFYGPCLKGSSLANLSITEKIISDLISVFKIIKDMDFPVKKFSLSSVFITDDGKVLLFPPLLMEFLNSRRSVKNSLEMIYPWNHPSLEGEQARAFTIAAIAYRKVSGKTAFPGRSEDEIQRSIKDENYTSPLIREPSLRTELVTMIKDSFRGAGNLDMWSDIPAVWNKKGMLEDSLSTKESADILKTAEKAEKKRQQKQRTQVFFEKNKIKLIITAAAVIVLGLVIKAPLSRALAPPATIGMSRIEVIELYYHCFETLDFETMKDCITSKEGKDDLNQITTLYVTTSARTAYEGSAGLLDADKWKADGQKPVDSKTIIWGLSNLRIEKISADTFEINYEKWFPSETDIPEVIFIKDIVHLSIIKDAWKIDGLQRASTGENNQ